MFSFDKLQEIQDRKSEEIPNTKIVVELFRHSLRENNPNIPNSENLLTPAGRELARERGREMNPRVENSLAGASPMDRAAETALLVMLSNQEEIKTGDSLAVLEEKIKESVPVGRKLYRDERLGFVVGDSPVGVAEMQSFKEGRYLEWLAKESDNQVLEYKDLATTSGLRQAGNIAELIERYKKLGNNFQRLMKDRKKQEQYGNNLERYLASHQGVAESFIMEVIKIQEGEQARDEFIKKFGNGWAETKGIHFEIVNSSEGQRVFASFEDANGPREIIIEPKTLENIIFSRAELERACRGNKIIKVE